MLLADYSIGEICFVGSDLLFWIDLQGPVVDRCAVVPGAIRIILLFTRKTPFFLSAALGYLQGDYLRIPHISVVLYSFNGQTAGKY